MKRTSSRSGRAVEAALREFALGFPETHEDFPWGHVAIKVRGKAFLFLGGSESGGVSLSVKLTASHASALDRPFATPTGYGLGKHGWVSAQFEPDDAVPLDVLRAWIDESYRAIAPKKLAATLSNAPASSARDEVIEREPRRAERAVRRARQAAQEGDEPTPKKPRAASSRKKSGRRKS
jgi:predicted DNA-binding protein (MmcQ/YjbR family)